MHGQVFDWFNYALSQRAAHEHVKPNGNNVLEIGSLNINGSIKPLFTELTSNGGSYLGIDLQEGPGVDIVVDGVAFRSETLFDIIVCAEVFEHTPVWPSIIANSYNHLVPGGFFIATMAGEGRPPHSAIDTNPIRSWEYYGNVTATDLAHYLEMFANGEVNVEGTDTRCWAVKQS